MYRDKKYQVNGFESHADFVDTIRFLRLDMGMTLQSIASLYGITKAYAHKLCPEDPQKKVVNRKPSDRQRQSQSVGSRPETGQGTLRDRQDEGSPVADPQV